MTDPSRRDFMAGLGAASLVGSPLMITRSDALTDLAAAYVRSESALPSRAFPYDIRRYGGEPSWAFSIAPDDTDALEDWVDSSNDRRLIRLDASTGTATVAAPIEDTAGGLATSGVASEGWVEQLDLDVSVGYIEPTLRVSEADFPAFSSLQAWAVDESAVPTSGLAFETNERTLGDARGTINDDSTAEGSNRLIGIIDTGVTYDSEVFGRELSDSTEPRIVDASKDFVAAGDPTVADEGLEAVEDENGHGSWVAAAAAAGPTDEDYRGVAPDSNILALRALDGDGQGSTADIAAAVRYGTDQGADALCLSLGAPFYSADLADAIAYATEEGVTVVAASGNDRYASRFLNFPASLEETIAVSATTADAQPADVQSAAFANIGPAPGTLDHSGGETNGVEVDLAAPGMELEAQTADGFETLSGTSMAAPFVAGAAALVADAEDPRERLTSTAQPTEQLAVAEAHHGLVDVTAAISDNESEETQDDVMIDEAEGRDTAYRSESAARGGLLGEVLF